jgi:hypothetical protein
MHICLPHRDNRVQRQDRRVQEDQHGGGGRLHRQPLQLPGLDQLGAQEGRPGRSQLPAPERFQQDHRQGLRRAGGEGRPGTAWPLHNRPERCAQANNCERLARGQVCRGDPAFGQGISVCGEARRGVSGQLGPQAERRHDQAESQGVPGIL